MYNEEKPKGIKDMRCLNCGTEIEDNANFCGNCGNPIEITNEIQMTKYCPKCGESMESEAHFCVKCGYGVNEKKKSHFGLIVAIVVVLVVCVVGGTGFYMYQKAKREAYEAYQSQLAAERQRQAEIHAYQKKSIELSDAINAAKSNFNLMSTMYSTSTEMNTGLFGPSFFTSYVQGLCSSELSEEKSRKKEIDALYDELNELNCSEEEVVELKKVIDDYYNSYEDRYKLLVEGNFSVYTFSSEEKASSSDFETKYKCVQEEINNIDRDALEESTETSDDIEGGTEL